MAELSTAGRRASSLGTIREFTLHGSTSVSILVIRGDGAELNWDNGETMKNISADKWIWSTNNANADIYFKLLVNDEYWSIGFNFIAKPGEKIEINPNF